MVKQLDQSRPATGLLAQLSTEQRKAAFAYTGSEDHGSDEFRNKAISS